jgi:hypothetical protein
MNKTSLNATALRMSQLKDREPSKNFSGKLPFRTQPEVHESITLAAKQAGKSINAWMEEVLREAANKKSSSLTSESTLPTSQSIQKLFQDQPDIVFELIDEIKPALKSHKTRDTVVLMGEIEKLVANYEVVRSQVRSDAPDPTALLLESVLNQTETANTANTGNTATNTASGLKGLTDCVTTIEATLSPRLNQPDRDHLLECTRAIGQVFVSVAAIRLYLKDSSVENTLNIIQQVIHHFSS